MTILLGELLTEFEDHVEYDGSCCAYNQTENALKHTIRKKPIKADPSNRINRINKETSNDKLRDKLPFGATHFIW